jgi:two-component system, LytTR family, sensor kinase
MNHAETEAGKNRKFEHDFSTSRQKTRGKETQPFSDELGLCRAKPSHRIRMLANRACCVSPLPDTMFRRAWRRWVLFFLAATLCGLFLASQSYLIYRSYESRAIPIVPVVVLALIQTWTWFLLLPGILAVADRFPLNRRGLSGSLVAHGVIGSLFALADIAVRVLINSWLPWYATARPVPFAVRFQNTFLNGFHSNLLVYWAIVGATQGLAYYRKLEERELRASQLETRLAQAQLQVLKIQLQPHFLFNTLHAISALVQKDPDAADHTIALLSDLLRLTLETGSEQEVSLQRELDFVERYLEIEQTRFGDRLTVRMEIADDVRDARVPSFVLQPLVENAIRHGIAPCSEGGRIEIIAARRDGELTMLVQDNGQGFVETPIREGLGLRNTRARLEQLYGAGDRLILTQAPGGGTVVTLNIPFRSRVLASAAGAQP